MNSPEEQACPHPEFPAPDTSIADVIAYAELNGPEFGEDVLIDSDEAGRLCNISGVAFARYSRNRRPKTNPAPLPVMRDMRTGRYLYSRRETIAFRDARPGRGNWNHR